MDKHELSAHIKDVIKSYEIFKDNNNLREASDAQRRILPKLDEFMVSQLEINYDHRQAITKLREAIAGLNTYEINPLAIEWTEAQKKALDHVRGRLDKLLVLLTR